MSNNWPSRIWVRHLLRSCTRTGWPALWRTSPGPAALPAATEA